MKFSHFHFALLSLALCTSIIATAQNKAPQLGKDPIADIIKSMTLEEKANIELPKPVTARYIRLTNYHVRMEILQYLACGYLEKGMENHLN